MEINSEEIIKKARKTPIWIKILYLVCIVAIIGSIFMITYKEEEKKPEPIDFTVDGAIGMEAGKYAYIDVEALIGEVATYGTGENDTTSDRYYLAFNNGYPYVINLSALGEENLKAIKDYTYSEEDNPEVPEPIRVYGMTKEFPIELKQIIVEEYPKIFGEEYQIEVADFENYFGSVLLDTRAAVVDTLAEELIIIFAFVILILLIATHAVRKVSTRRTSKYLKKNDYEEDLKNQLENNVEEKHYKDKIVLTKDYFVDMTKGFVAFKFSDIQWVHIHNVKYYGIFNVSTNVVVHLKDAKTTMQVMNIKGKATDEFMDIFHKICEKAPEDSLKGYTPENVKAFKQYKKGL